LPSPHGIERLEEKNRLDGIRKWPLRSLKIPDDWKKDPAKLNQKDTEARWTKKNDQTFYGYKDHVKFEA
jgi:hypothetical protein